MNVFLTYLCACSLLLFSATSSGQSTTDALPAVSGLLLLEAGDKGSDGHLIFDDFSSDTLSEWTVLNPESTGDPNSNLAIENDQLSSELVSASVWFNDNNDALFIHQQVDTSANPEFRMTTLARARDADDTGNSIASGFHSVGLMIRDPASDDVVGTQNYVLIGIGYINGSNNVEQKNTVDGNSTIQYEPTTDGDADLRLCKHEDKFNAYVRPAGSNEPWVLAQEWSRPDLGALTQLQVGMVAYSFAISSGDTMRFYFDEVAVEAIETQEECAN